MSGHKMFSAAVALGFALGAFAQDAGTPATRNVLPEVNADSDGTIHWSARTIPPAAMASEAARRAYAEQMVSRTKAKQANPADTERTDLNSLREAIAAEKRAALAKYTDVEVQEDKIGGINVSIYTPKTMPAKNRKLVAMEFEIDSEGVAVANFAQMKVISVHYRLNPSRAAHDDILAVYKELLKTYQPKNIGMFGTSGGCNFTQTTVLWLAHLKLPLPGAVGLNTCAGGSAPGDSRFTNNGLDPLLSTAFTGRSPFGGTGRAPATTSPDDPPASSLDGTIPKGYPPAFLLAGTRDMCLSQTVLLHRKLRNAGVEADLNIFEGMWHAFHGNPNLPESSEAMAALAHFFTAHLGK
jgi:monoterpene epsilon-lactone hydrolase